MVKPWQQDNKALSPLDKETLIDLERLAKRLAWQSEQITYAVEYCKRNNTTQGLADMVAYSFNAAQFTPKYAGSSGLPAGPNGENVKYKVVIINMYMDNVENNGVVVGGYMAIEMVPIEGPFVGTKHTDRLNLHNTGPNAMKVIEIANNQLSAYSHVVGKYNWAMTEELYNIPFMIEIGKQIKKPEFTEVKAVFDINGNEPGKAGAGAQQQQQQQQPITAPAAGVTAQGGWGPGAGQPQQQQQPGPGGGYPIDNNVPMTGQGQPAAGGWQGGPAPQQQQQPGPAAGGWGPGAGQPAAQQQPGPGAWGGGAPAQQQPGAWGPR